jgi:hypothetical protein
VTKGGEKYIMRNNLFSSPNIISVVKSKRMRWAERVACMGKMGNVYKILVRKPEVGAVWRPRRKWEGNIELDLK